MHDWDGFAKMFLLMFMGTGLVNIFITPISETASLCVLILSLVGVAWIYNGIG